jgi:Na+/citrate or Na+/malate symporter
MVAYVIDLTKPYNWLAIVFVMLVGGFVLRQIGNRVPIVRQVNTAAGQAA